MNFYNGLDLIANTGHRLQTKTKGIRQYPEMMNRKMHLLVMMKTRSGLFYDDRGMLCID